jgi:hypothetical protein
MSHHLHTLLGLDAPSSPEAYAAATKRDLLLAVEHILSIIAPPTAPQAERNAYYPLASICRHLSIPYTQSQAVLASQPVYGKIRSQKNGTRTEYHLGDFERNVEVTPYNRRPRAIR